jgi:cytochrome c553
MNRTQWFLLSALAAVAIIVILLALRNRQPPFLPADAEHARWENAETCLTCHGPGGTSPQSKGHPLGMDCLRCHGAR